MAGLALVGCHPEGANAPARFARVLDVAGRLLDRRGYVTEAVLVGPDGRPQSLWGWEGSRAFELPEGARGEVLVASPGHRVERVPVAARGDTIVRLRAGIRVTLHVRWDGTLPPGCQDARVELEGTYPVAGGETLRIRSLPDDRFDVDDPDAERAAPLTGPDPDVVLVAPEPGRYDVSWSVRTPTAHCHRTDAAQRVEVRADVDGLRFEVEAPMAGWRDDARRYGGGR